MAPWPKTSGRAAAVRARIAAAAAAREQRAKLAEDRRISAKIRGHDRANHFSEMIRRALERADRQQEGDEAR